MNKKGISEAVLWIIRILILVAVVAVISIIKTIALQQALQTYDTEFYIANTKTLYSPTGLAYQSLATGRTYPGIIDIAEFNENTLNKSMTTNTPLRMTLSDTNNIQIKQIYFNKERFQLLEPLTFSGKYELLNKTNYVLLKEDNQLKPAILDIEMVISR